MDYTKLKEEWIGSQITQNKQPETATEIYRDAVKRFTHNLTQDGRKVAFAEHAASLQDVERLVRCARGDFESSHNQKLKKWLGRVTSRLMYYGNIFDVLAQHHPEYVALAWGAMKFLFVAVMNHENAIVCLAKGITRIADALPRIGLATLLYPTRRMENAAEELYAYVLQFFIRAHDWYLEGTFRHILHSITRPAELRYHDLLENISNCSRNIDQLAVSGSQVELREVHKSLQAVTSKLERSENMMQEMKAIIINYQTINSSSLLDTNQKVSDLQFSEMIEIVSKVALPDPTESYKHGFVMRKRRQMRNQISIPKAFWRSTTLQRFSESQSSSLVLVKGTFQSRYSLRDAAVMITEELHRKSIPVLWGVRTGIQDSPTGYISPSDVLKSLVAQALRLNPSLHSEKSTALSCARLRTAINETEWFQVLGSALESLHQKVHIMLDLELLIQSSSEDLEDIQIFELFSNLFQALSSKGLGHSVKVMIFTYRPFSAQNPPREGFSNIVLPTDSPVRSRQRPKHTKTFRRTIERNRF